MAVFNISRIHTQWGIFRVSGLWSTPTEIEPKVVVDIDVLELMGTDGWVVLDKNNVKVVDLIQQITPTLQAHLQET